MKKAVVILFVALLALVIPATVMAQTRSGTAKGICTNGLTGIIVTPTAMVGWEASNIGLDAHYSIFLDPTTHVPTVTISFLKKAEIAIALEIDQEELTNIFFNGKFQVYQAGGAAIAVGGNLEFVQGDRTPEDFATSVFVIATYSGDFFKMPAVTSLLFGWQLRDPWSDELTTNFNFSMGFEMCLFPQVFKNYLFWITDFSNYSYVNYVASGIQAGHRGSLNTGIRLDILKKGNMKLQADMFGTDLLDEERGFAAAITFGIGF